MDDTTISKKKRTVRSSEFKREAVARLKSGCNATALALELDVKRSQLYKWAQRFDEVGADNAFKGPGRPAGVEEDELAKLRRENDRLKMENTILKKAEAYFAQRKR